MDGSPVVDCKMWLGGMLCQCACDIAFKCGNTIPATSRRRRDMTEKMLKVTLNWITQTHLLLRVFSFQKNVEGLRHHTANKCQYKLILQFTLDHWLVCMGTFQNEELTGTTLESINHILSPRSIGTNRKSWDFRFFSPPWYLHEKWGSDDSYWG